MSSEVNRYYQLQLALTGSSAIAGNIPSSEYDWLSGKKINHTFSRPLVFHFSPGAMHHYFPLDIPLMSDQLLEALRELGVDNIDIYPAVAQADGSDDIYCHYKAVNVVGVVFVDQAQKDPFGADMDFPVSSQGIIVDEKSRNGLLLFRMSGSKDIIVCEHLKDKLETQFDDLGFTLL